MIVSRISARTRKTILLLLGAIAALALHSNSIAADRDPCDSPQSSAAVYACVAVDFTVEELKGEATAKLYESIMLDLSNSNFILANKFLKSTVNWNSQRADLIRHGYQRVAKKWSTPSGAGFLKGLGLNAVLFMAKEGWLYAVEKYCCSEGTPEYVESEAAINQAFAVIASLPPFSLPGTFIISLTIQETALTIDSVIKLYDTYDELQNEKGRAMLSTLSAFATTANAYAATKVRGLPLDNRLVISVNQAMQFFYNEDFSNSDGADLADFGQRVAPYLLAAKVDTARFAAGQKISTLHGREQMQQALNGARQGAMELDHWYASGDTKRYFLAYTMLRDFMFTPKELQSIGADKDFVAFCKTCEFGFNP